MLLRDLMVRTNNGPLKERPDVLKRVCMNDAAYILFFIVVNRSVKRIVIADALVALVLICNYQRGFFCKFRLDESMEDFPGRGFLT